MIMNKVRLIGLSHIKEKDPSLINKARRKFFSNIPPKMKPKMSGGIG